MTQTHYTFQFNRTTHLVYLDIAPDDNYVLQINGERHPSEVYNDFRAAILKILGTPDKMAVMVPNGVLPLPPTTTASIYKPPTKGYPPVMWVIGGLT